MNKQFRRLLLVLSVAVVPAVHAQSPSTDEHAGHHAASPAAAAQDLPSEGEVRKVNRDTGKVTLRHGPLANLDMPAMTMVFTAADAALLEDLHEGDKVRFRAEKKDGVFLVTAIRVVR